MTERCDRCRFFSPNPPASEPETITFSADGVRGGGDCRREPPVLQEHHLACFPLVACGWWCGEFEPRTRPTRPGAMPVAATEDK